MQVTQDSIKKLLQGCNENVNGTLQSDDYITFPGDGFPVADLDGEYIGMAQAYNRLPAIGQWGRMEDVVLIETEAGTTSRAIRCIDRFVAPTNPAIVDFTETLTIPANDAQGTPERSETRLFTGSVQLVAELIAGQAYGYVTYYHHIAKTTVSKWVSASQIRRCIFNGYNSPIGYNAAIQPQHKSAYAALHLRRMHMAELANSLKRLSAANTSYLEHMGASIIRPDGE